VGTQWIDEEPYPGPAQGSFEEWQAIANALSSGASGLAGVGTYLHRVTFPRSAGKSAVSKMEEAMRDAAKRMNEAARKIEDREWSMVVPDYRTPPTKHYGPPPKKRFSRRNRRTF
jgi:hypothetical protein